MQNGPSSTFPATGTPGTSSLQVPDSLSTSSSRLEDCLPRSSEHLSLESLDERGFAAAHHSGPRRSSRSRVAPTWLKDFVQPKPHKLQSDPSSSQSHSLHSAAVYPLLQPADLSHLSHDFVASLISVMHIPEPHTYSQAKDSPEWVVAMEAELQALETNGTWSLTTLPPHTKPLSSKQVYRVKFRPDGSIERYKARLVIREFQQVKDKDYKHIFSPVAKLTTVRVFIALATARGWPLHQLDINNAFLHGFIDEDVYMLPPEGYTKALPGQVCKLERSLYGLKQASR